MYIKVRVTPGCKKEIVTKVGAHTYEIVVKEKPERNMVNKRLQTILSEQMNVHVRDVRLITGHRSQSKIFDVTLEV